MRTHLLLGYLHRGNPDLLDMSNES